MSRDKTTGFTLIELMLAMTFISILLLAIALTTIQISNIYNKGITLREVNQAGRSVTEDLRRSIALSMPFDTSSNYVSRDGGGRLCIGGYSYAWNYGKAIVGGAGAPALLNVYDDAARTPVRFAKVVDPGASLCTDAMLAQPVARADATELLSSGDRDLALHKFTIKQTDSNPSASQALYAISMTIGTNDRQQLADAACKPPSEGVGNEAYCSVNQFDIIARAGNNLGGK